MGETSTTNTVTATLVGEPRVHLDLSADDAGKLRELLGNTGGNELYDLYKALAGLDNRIPAFKLTDGFLGHTTFTRD